VLFFPTRLSEQPQGRTEIDGVFEGDKKGEGGHIRGKGKGEREKRGKK
jgi:hypothetical protein